MGTAGLGLTRELDFAIVGAAKCGTTAVSEALELRSDVHVMQPKDAYVLLYPEHNPSWVGEYEDKEVLPKIAQARDAYAAQLAKVDGKQPVGDAGALYLEIKEGVEAVGSALKKDGKVLIFLRRPDDRAYSAYGHLVRDGWEKLSFEAALSAEEGRLRDGASPLWGYRRGGRYADRIEHAFDVFGRDNVEICFFEDLKADPDGVGRRVSSFIGLSSPLKIGRSNVSGVPRSRLVQDALYQQSVAKRLAKRVIPRNARILIRRTLTNSNTKSLPPMSTETRRTLISDFAADIERVARLTDRDLGHWLVSEK